MHKNLKNNNTEEQYMKERFLMDGLEDCTKKYTVTHMENSYYFLTKQENSVRRNSIPLWTNQVETENINVHSEEWH